MKIIFKTLLPLFCSILFFTKCQAQTTQAITGTWAGTAAVNGQALKAVFHISQADGQYAATFDSPDQDAIGLKANGVIVSGDSITIDLKVIGGKFTGRWNRKDEINGAIQQGGYSFPVVLTRAVDEAPISKPQTPKPPFNYVSEDVEYNNGMQQVHLGATLTKPNGPGKFPVVILITGSGPQDRDESIGLHKPFWVIADHLTKNGIAVLRVDDRGVGKSTGNFQKSTSADFATDVIAGIEYLKTRTDIDTKHIGLLGHSEGGVIAPYVAARNEDVNFIVCLAGPVVGGKLTNEYQNMLPMKKSGLSQPELDAFLLLHRALVNDALTTEDTATYNSAIAKSFLEWKRIQPESTTKNFVQGSDDEVISSFRKSYKDFRNSWWKFFMTHDFIQDIKDLHCAVLALNGEKDEQVESKPNLAAFDAALKESKNKNFRTVEIPGVNHLFQKCKECGSIKEYLSLDETFSTAALDIITSWIKTTVK